MDNLIIILLILLVGLILGIFFFGGLWWTTKKGVVSKSPVIWFFGSLIIRLGVTVAVIYFVSNSHWERMLVCLAGFIIARTIVLKVTQLPEVNKLVNKPKEAYLHLFERVNSK